MTVQSTRRISIIRIFVRHQWGSVRFMRGKPLQTWGRLYQTNHEEYLLPRALAQLRRHPIDENESWALCYFFQKDEERHNTCESCGLPLPRENTTQDSYWNSKLVYWNNELSCILTVTVCTYSNVFNGDHPTRLTQTRTGPLWIKRIFTEYFKLKVAILVIYLWPDYWI